MRRQLRTCLVLIAVGTGVLCAQQNFPKGAFSKDDWGDSFRTGWYSHELKILEEPPLYGLERDKTAESYRFLWLRTFDQPVAVRMDIAKDGSGTLTVKVANGSSGFPQTQTHLIDNISRPISTSETRMFLARIRRFRFWELPMHSGAGGLDGAEWIIEGIKGGNYHIVSRWSPGEGEIRELGLAVLGLTHLNIPADKIY